MPNIEVSKPTAKAPARSRDMFTAMREEMDRLFDRFYRVERSRNRSAGGSGLGLGVVKALVQAHVGQIRATASALGGLAVTIVLPAGKADGAAK